jgi:hypothetical protein
MRKSLTYMMQRSQLTADMAEPSNSMLNEIDAPTLGLVLMISQRLHTLMNGLSTAVCAEHCCSHPASDPAKRSRNSMPGRSLKL